MKLLSVTAYMGLIMLLIVMPALIGAFTGATAYFLLGEFVLGLVLACFVSLVAFLKILVELGGDF